MGYDDDGVFEPLFRLMRKPTAEEMAQRELEESRRSLLECQRMKDYYDNMVNFHTKRIISLTKKADTTKGYAVELRA